MPRSGCVSTGMPRPLSSTVTEPSLLMVTEISRGVAGHRLVDRVVDHFVDQVVQAADVACRRCTCSAARGRAPGRSRCCICSAPYSPSTLRQFGHVRICSAGLRSATGSCVGISSDSIADCDFGLENHERRLDQSLDMRAARASQSIAPTRNRRSRIVFVGQQFGRACQQARSSETSVPAPASNWPPRTSSTPRRTCPAGVLAASAAGRLAARPPHSSAACTRA